MAPALTASTWVMILDQYAMSSDINVRTMARMLSEIIAITDDPMIAAVYDNHAARLLGEVR